MQACSTGSFTAASPMSDESTPREKDFMDMDDEFENPLGGGGSDEPGASLHARKYPAAASELSRVPRATCSSPQARRCLPSRTYHARRMTSWCASFACASTLVLCTRQREPRPSGVCA